VESFTTPEIVLCADASCGNNTKKTAAGKLGSSHDDPLFDLRKLVKPKLVNDESEETGR
jgi:hypothetical protein